MTIITRIFLEEQQRKIGRRERASQSGNRSEGAMTASMTSGPVVTGACRCSLPSIFGFKRYSSPRTVQTYPPHQILTHAIESRLDRLNNRRRICDRSVVYIGVIARSDARSLSIGHRHPFSFSPLNKWRRSPPSAASDLQP